MSSANVSSSFYAQFEMNIADDIYISIPRGNISRYTQWPNNVGFLSVFIVTNILFLEKNLLNVGKNQFS